MNSTEASRVEQILDLLLDALAERQAARQGPEEELISTPAPIEFEDVAPSVDVVPFSDDAPSSDGVPEEHVEVPLLPDRIEDHGREETDSPLPVRDLPPVPVGQMSSLLPRLVVALLLLVILVNIPLNRHGVNLARAMPDSAALIIRDGLLLKGEGGDRIYVLDDDELRWISSLDAFERMGYRWRDVHIVEDSFLAKFEQGQPVHVLLKCSTSPHVYRIEREQKRWIKDIPTFLAEGHVWEDVHTVSCQYLRGLPDGQPIPPDAGLPPQP